MRPVLRENFCLAVQIHQRHTVNLQIQSGKDPTDALRVWNWRARQINKRVALNVVHKTVLEAGTLRANKRLLARVGSRVPGQDAGPGKALSSLADKGLCTA